MVPASPISGIMCDHYPVPLITTRPWVCVRENQKETEGKRCFVRKNMCDTGKRENEKCVCTCACTTCMCVYVCADSWPSLPQHPPCHFQLQRASGLSYSITQLTRPHLLNTKRQSAISALIHEARLTVLTVILRSCWELIIWEMYFTVGPQVYFNWIEFLHN